MAAFHAPAVLLVMAPELTAQGLCLEFVKICYRFFFKCLADSRHIMKRLVSLAGRDQGRAEGSPPRTGPTGHSGECGPFAGRGDEICLVWYRSPRAARVQ